MRSGLVVDWELLDMLNRLTGLGLDLRLGLSLGNLLNLLNFRLNNMVDLLRPRARLNRLHLLHTWLGFDSHCPNSQGVRCARCL